MKDINTKINHTSSMNQANTPKNASQTVASVPRCLPGISPHGPLQSPRPTNNHSALKGSRLAVLVLPHDSVFFVFADFFYRFSRVSRSTGGFHDDFFHSAFILRPRCVQASMCYSQLAKRELMWHRECQSKHVHRPLTLPGAEGGPNNFGSQTILEAPGAR